MPDAVSDCRFKRTVRTDELRLHVFLRGSGYANFASTTSAMPRQDTREMSAMAALSIACHDAGVP
jgi:hypothetical protein